VAPKNTKASDIPFDIDVVPDGAKSRSLAR
jgi:hypothetical protein